MKIWLLLMSVAVYGEMIPVPQHAQSTNYTCGAACMQSLLGYYGEQNDMHENSIAVALEADPEEGIRPLRIVAYARSRGYLARLESSMTLEQLYGYIDAKQPVICGIQAWGPPGTAYTKAQDHGHDVIAIGHCGSNILFMDPSVFGNYAYLDKESFERRWFLQEKEGGDHMGIIIPGTRTKRSFYSHWGHCRNYAGLPRHPRYS